MTALEQQELIRVLRMMGDNIARLEEAVRSHDHSQQPPKAAQAAPIPGQPSESILQTAISKLERTLKGLP